MAWTGVITNAGANLLDQWALGGTLTITSAATGTGTVDTAALVNQTNLKSRKQTASIISKVRKSSGVKVKLQITAPSTGYTLNQYGVWAKLGSGAAVLLALFQREDGVPIPSSAETPEFVYTLYALLTISNTGTLEVTVDTSALVSQSTLEEAMDTKVDKVSGKGLSTNDYTTAEKNKLAGIEAQANKYTHPAYTARTGKPTANLTPGFGDTVTVSQITSDASGHVTGATDRTIKIPATAASTSAAGLMSAADKTKLNGIATGAEVNQNAFSNVKVGSTTIAADAKTDTLEIVAGDNITLTPDATNDKVTIKATDTTYTSKAAASGGTALSLVTTGEKHTWNSKAAGSHTHTASAVTDLLTAETYGPSALVSFDGMTGGLPVKSCRVATAAGSGSVNVYRTGKNLVDQKQYTASNVVWNGDTASWTVPSGTNYSMLRVPAIRLFAGVTYTASCRIKAISKDPNYAPRIAFRTTDWLIVKQASMGESATEEVVSCSYTPSADTDMYIGVIGTGSPGNGCQLKVSQFQLEVGSSRTGYDPYRGGVWTYDPAADSLTPPVMSSLAGVNNIWSDGGNVTVEYGAFLRALEEEVENHTHDVADIASGILPVARGGTGNSTGYVTAGLKSGTTLGQNATAEGEWTEASGRSAHAEGTNTVASKNFAHAEGGDTTASGIYSHAEGSLTTASQMDAHAEGNRTTASGAHSHAEGYETTASGVYSHAQGLGTIAAGEAQHVFGEYNVSDDTYYVEIVGWGTSSTRKNIRTLSRTGSMTIAGTLTQSSDARLKDVQGEVPDLSSIRAVRFKWNDTNGEHDDKEHIGYIAQEVEKIAPYLVGDDSNGYKSLDYIALLCAKVEWLERRVAELEGKEAGA